MGASAGVTEATLVGLATWLVGVLVAGRLALAGHRGPAETAVRRLTYGRRPGPATVAERPDPCKHRDVSTATGVPGDSPPLRWWWGHPLGEARAHLELARLLVSGVYRGEGVPAGDGSPVLLIPGFLAGDVTLAVMHGWLRKIGYRSYRSGIT